MTAREMIGEMTAGSPGLSGEARRFMAAVGGKLDGMAEDVDEGALRMLMLSYDMYVKASRALLSDGPLLRDKRGNVKAHPAEKVAKTYYAQVLAFMREYGLTIRSRERIKAYGAGEDEEDELMKLLTSRG